ncbi:MAG: Tat pathway signal protein [Verrucomicrobiales bacterium]|nr:Tat pathway signal protein [Verrucomicrobiales bacterium]
MNRRSFVQKAGMATVGLAATGNTLHLRAGDSPAPPTPPTTKNWIWTGVQDRATPDEQRRRFERFRTAGIDAVLFSGVDAQVFALAKEQGLETHAWTWTLCRGDRDLLEQHPDWYVVNRLGESAATKPPYVGYYHFLCPSHEEVSDHLADLFGRLADTPHLDGVHLDYVRYPDVILPVALWKKYNLVQNEELPQFDFCYCDVCRAAFKQQTGVDPREQSDPPADAAWRQYRYDTVTRLVQRLAEVAHGKGKQITAAVFPTPSIARRLVRQDWTRWNLDAVLPMTYHRFYNEEVDWIEGAVREGVTALPADRPLYAGLFLPDLKTEEDFDQAVRCALTGGAKGVSLFGGLRDIKPARQSAGI